MFPLALRLYYSVVFVGREVYEWQVVRVGCQIRQVLRTTAPPSGGSGGLPNKAVSSNIITRLPHLYSCAAALTY